MARKEQKQWYRLDNAGVLYSALKKEKYAPVYRFSAVMKETVDPAGGGSNHAAIPMLPRADSKGRILVLF